MAWITIIKCDIEIHDDDLNENNGNSDYDDYDNHH